ncbi:ABC-2 type transport system permease protein [Clostridium cavendishii DSM 21758]|uniref:ABC-2 type transport system permease protein n=1 Tax=Clostridium cavendishii DSM 21758 TaxID=1121302 RepID=A0A1M6UW15_9CLOT|nr:ABC transporter permease [Clostridium cavendishii]SHK73325.1 ABC-2 type transport system permease protein [Clostridium cavendishii DSM 21758]
MRIKATIMVTLKSLVYGWKNVLLMFCVFPLILALIIGNSQKEHFKPEVNRDKINITLIDEDNSKLSNSFKELLNSDDMKKIFNITNKGDYILIIPKNYQENLINAKETTIKIDEKKRISSTNELIITNLIREYGEKVSENIVIQNKIALSDIENKYNLYATINEKITKLYEKSSLNTTIVKAERVLTSMENQAATLMTYMMFTIVMSCIASYNLDKENGSFKRLISTPMTKMNFFNLDLIIFFISSFIFGLVYLLGFRVAGFAFKDTNPINLFCILICQSVLIACISGIIIAFFNKKIANIIVIFLMYFQIIFGGGFIPVDVIGNQTVRSLTNFAPGNMLSQVYKSCIITNSITNFSKELLLMLIVAGCLYLISVIKINIRWEE